ncbi:hypothetical protein POJ06DRAFT_243988 [Lipomyces tetrasporus]|uniref:HRQ family protein 1 n=1 Tax=Lipomyces tetrasporus TaxID=54092 RepID=A0AAD7QZD4_9ASCO|nr:uncharacterized protein POJ06DRAFT_243988 [Lipomyces tetrasporus]KAJ8104233.1 hypothetical protein POJ06DRAFT_243988 [Lipomyces tetrasporus]
MGVITEAADYLKAIMPNEFLVVGLALIVLLQISRFSLKFYFSAPRNLATAQETLKMKGVEKSEIWTPVDFKTPAPEQYPNWDIKDTKPLPYRPFKHNYHVTMGIRNMNWQEWIELDNEFLKYHKRKCERLAERREKLVMTAPEAYDAAMELLEEFREWLPARYPTLFKRTDVGIDNLVTGESFNIAERPLKDNVDPMEIAAKLVQDDLAIMMPGEDGQYYLKSACILLAGFWRLADKFGMPLSEIHTSGDVPQFKEKLQVSMERFFVRMRVDKPVVRNNYFLQTDDDLGWSRAIGPEDNDDIGWDAAEHAHDITKMHFRSERQSLRRLPKSGGVVFTIRTYFVPITELAKEPYVPGRLADGIRAWSDDVALYKGKRKFDKIVLEYLDEQHKKQVEAGLSLEKEPSQYPF